jgi:hypothetical protein
LDASAHAAVPSGLASAPGDEEPAELGDERVGLLEAEGV